MNQDKNIINKEKNNISINGKIDADNIISTINKMDKYINNYPRNTPIIVNLKGLENPNTIQISFMLNILRSAQNQNKKAFFTSIPISTKNIIKIHNLASILNPYCREQIA